MLVHAWERRWESAYWGHKDTDIQQSVLECKIPW